MFSSENSPALPDTPEFSRDMEKALIAAARGRSSHRPSRAARLRKPAIALVAAAAVVIGVGIGIDHALSDGPVSNSLGSSRGTAGAGARPVHIHLASFSVNRTANGTVTVTMFSNHTPDAAALRKALATAGVLAW